MVAETFEPAGRATGSSAEQFAAAVTQLWSVPDPLRRRAARGRAEGYPWSATIERFLGRYRELGSGQFDLERNEHSLPLPAQSGWALR
jgi:hypothetical protein